MTFGLDWGWGSDVEASRAIMDRYTDRGGNFLDTANIYTKGHSEKIIGDHIGRHPSRRERLVIATKFMGSLHPRDPNAGGAGRKNIVASLEESLRRLQTGYIDLLWMHWSDPHTPMEETMRALDDLVRAGKVRYIGFSDTPAWRVMQASMLGRFRGWAPLCALQIEYSLLERTVEADLIPVAIDQGLGVTPWSPLKGGALTGKYTRAAHGQNTAGRGQWVTNALNDQAYKVIEALVAVAAELNTTPSRTALAWVQSKPGVASSIIGARTMEQLEDNLGALDIALSPAQIARLDEVSKPQLPFPHEFLKGAWNISQGGTTINGRPSEVWPLAPQTDAERH
jgi:aryl-alcohol dehydrogenase-like predicted oxidoreductase